MSEPTWMDDLFSETPVEDDGFVEDVVGALPPRRPLRRAVILATAVVAALACVALVGGANDASHHLSSATTDVVALLTSAL